MLMAFADVFAPHNYGPAVSKRASWTMDKQHSASIVIQRRHVTADENETTFRSTITTSTET